MEAGGGIGVDVRFRIGWNTCPAIGGFPMRRPRPDGGNRPIHRPRGQRFISEFNHSTAKRKSSLPSRKPSFSLIWAR